MKFTIKHTNTCSNCGTLIPIGADVFAPDWDKVRSGAGICKKCAQIKPKAKEAEEPKPPEETVQA